MKQLDIWIKAKEIANRVEHETTLLARAYSNRGQQQIYDNITMDADQILVFRTHFKEASEKAKDKCAAYTKRTYTTLGEDDSDITKMDEDFFVILFMPDTFPEPTAPGIDRAIYDHLIAWVIYRWLETKLPQEALLFKLRSETNLSDLISRLERRYTAVKRPYKLF